AQRRALAHFGRFAPRTTAVAVSLPIASHDNAQARGGDTPGTRPGTTSRCLVLLLRSSGPIPGPDPARGTGPPGYGEHEGAPVPGAFRSPRTRRRRSPPPGRECPTVATGVGHEKPTTETEELWPFPSGRSSRVSHETHTNETEELWPFPS